ncbi:MAG TPA: enoyl-CoA hydratase-related protein [Bacillales bacterium]|nr:enoyl-CoA hydratase-related protein [Bacillales bacterium]
MAAPLVKYEQMDGSIVKLTLNRSEAANALSSKLISDLTEALDDVTAQGDVRCIILTGAGEKAFCAGADLKERLAMTEEEVPLAVAKIGALTAKIAAMPIPVVAVLNGVAFGGGLEIALACDIRIASNSIQVGLTETGLGIIPGAGGTQRLPRLIGEGNAKNMILRAKRLSATEAYRIGLLQEIYPQDELETRSYQASREIARNAPIAIVQAKQAINDGMQVPLDEGLTIEKSCYQTTIATLDRVEGLRAFQEKRPPVYIGK